MVVYIEIICLVIRHTLHRSTRATRQRSPGVPFAPFVRKTSAPTYGSRRIFNHSRLAPGTGLRRQDGLEISPVGCGERSGATLAGDLKSLVVDADIDVGSCGFQREVCPFQVPWKCGWRHDSNGERNRALPSPQHFTPPPQPVTCEEHGETMHRYPLAAPRLPTFRFSHALKTGNSKQATGSRGARGDWGTTEECVAVERGPPCVHRTIFCFSFLFFFFFFFTDGMWWKRGTHLLSP